MSEWLHKIRDAFTSNRTRPAREAHHHGGDDADSSSLATRWIHDGTPGRDPADDLPLTGPRPFARSYAWLRSRLAAVAAFMSARSTGWEAIADDTSEAHRLHRIDENNKPRIGPLRDMWARVIREHERLITNLGPLMYRSTGIGAKRRYWFVVSVLVVSDIGMIVASNSNGAGDAIVWALLQGLGTGTSIMACGQLGALARERDERAQRPKAPPTGFEHCAVWYGTAKGSTESINYALAAGFGLLFFIQMAMRSLNGGPLEGIGFAALAMILLLGSAANAYTYGAADPISRYSDELGTLASQTATLLEQLEAPGANAAKLTRRAKVMMRHYLDLGRAAGNVILAEGAHTAASIAHPDVYGFYDTDPINADLAADTATETDSSRVDDGDPDDSVDNQTTPRGPDGDLPSPNGNGTGPAHTDRPTLPRGRRNPSVDADDGDPGTAA